MSPDLRFEMLAFVPFGLLNDYIIFVVIVKEADRACVENTVLVSWHLGWKS
jgi:hypothetical protein